MKTKSYEWFRRNNVLVSDRCIGEYADLLTSTQDALPGLEGGAAACPAAEAMPHEEVLLLAHMGNEVDT